MSSEPEKNKTYCLASVLENIHLCRNLTKGSLMKLWATSLNGPSEPCIQFQHSEALSSHVLSPLPTWRNSCNADAFMGEDFRVGTSKCDPVSRQQARKPRKCRPVMDSGNYNLVFNMRANLRDFSRRTDTAMEMVTERVRLGSPNLKTSNEHNVILKITLKWKIKETKVNEYIMGTRRNQQGADSKAKSKEYEI